MTNRAYHMHPTFFRAARRRYCASTVRTGDLRRAKKMSATWTCLARAYATALSASAMPKFLMDVALKNTRNRVRVPGIHWSWSACVARVIATPTEAHSLSSQASSHESASSGTPRKQAASAWVLCLLCLLCLFSAWGQTGMGCARIWRGQKRRERRSNQDQRSDEKRARVLRTTTAQTNAPKKQASDSPRSSSD